MEGFTFALSAQFEEGMRMLRVLLPTGASLALPVTLIALAFSCEALLRPARNQA